MVGALKAVNEALKDTIGFDMTEVMRAIPSRRRPPARSIWEVDNKTKKEEDFGTAGEKSET